MQVTDLDVLDSVKPNLPTCHGLDSSMVSIPVTSFSTGICFSLYRKCGNSLDKNIKLIQAYGFDSKKSTLSNTLQQTVTLRKTVPKLTLADFHKV